MSTLNDGENHGDGSKKEERGQIEMNATPERMVECELMSAKSMQK